MTKLFTLSGGHLFSLYDGCREEGIDLVDIRHEQTAAFAAEGWAKVTREPGVAALTAGPGRDERHERDRLGAARTTRRCVVLGGRAPAMRWGQGSLQEIDHVPFVAAADEARARPREATAEIPGLVDEALRDGARARTPGPTFVDFPLDLVFMEAEDRGARRRRCPSPADEPAADATGIERAVALLRDAERPVIMAGTNLYWGHGEDALRALVRERSASRCSSTASARGCVPADHELFFSPRARRGAEGRRRRARDRRADGLPPRLRRRRSARTPRSSSIDRAEPLRDAPARGRGRAATAASRATLDALREGTAGAGAGDRARGSSSCAAIETEKRAAEQAELDDDRAPLHPMRIYARARTRCSTATRSSSATAATSSPTPGA